MAGPAFEKFKEHRDAAYEQLKAQQRDEKQELRRDQAAGVRRIDVLTPAASVHAPDATKAWGKDEVAAHKEAEKAREHAIMHGQQVAGRHEKFRDATHEVAPGLAANGLTPPARAALARGRVPTEEEAAREQQARAYYVARRGAEQERRPTNARGETTERRGEISDRAREKRDKDQGQEARRQAALDWYIAKRGHDRAQEQEGGRER